MLKPDTQKIKVQIEQHIQSRVQRRQYGKNSNIKRTAYSGPCTNGCKVDVFMSPKLCMVYFPVLEKKHKQTRLRCVFKTPPELYLNLGETRQKKRKPVDDCPVHGGCSHATKVLVISSRSARRK